MNQLALPQIQLPPAHSGSMLALPAIDINLVTIDPRGRWQLCKLRVQLKARNGITQPLTKKKTGPDTREREDVCVRLFMGYTRSKVRRS